MFSTLEKYLAESIKVKYTHILRYSNSITKDLMSRKPHIPSKRHLQAVNSKQPKNRNNPNTNQQKYE